MTNDMHAYVQDLPMQVLNDSSRQELVDTT